MFGPLFDRRCIAGHTQCTITHMYWSSRRIISAACLLIMLVTIGGCDRNGTATNKDSQQNRADSQIRIVSLSTALTRIAVDPGCGDLIVGRTRFCKSVDSAIPVIGDHFAQDFESLVRVRPTPILIQPPRNDSPSALAEQSGIQSWTNCN